MKTSNRRIKRDLPYFDWLVIKVEGNKHLGLLNIAFDMPFISLIPNDENRIQDGLELRKEWFKKYGTDFDIDFNQQSNLFEVLVALSIRIEGVTSDVDNRRYTAKYWFWKMIENLGLNGYDYTHLTPSGIENIRETFLAMINREYQPNGQGGLFPFREVDRDQRDVELWYQMHQWLLATVYSEENLFK